MINYEVQGIKQFEQAMKGLNEKMRRREILKIIRKVAGPVEKAAKLEVQKMERDAWTKHGRINTGNLEASIGRIQGKSKDFPNIQVAPRVKSRFYGHHAHLVHFGTRLRRGRARKGLTSRRYNRGSMPANPFMQRAFDKTFNAVRADFEKQIASVVEKFANE